MEIFLGHDYAKGRSTGDVDKMIKKNLPRVDGRIKRNEEKKRNVSERS